MDDIKTIFVALISGVLVMLNPIEDFVIAMLLVFSLNYLVGWIADVVQGGGWSMKKTFSFGMQCFIFYGIIVFLFLIGHFLHKHTESLIAVQYVCLLAAWAYTRNTLRNLKENILNHGSTLYLIVDILYYVISFEMLERLPWVKNYLIEKNESIRNTHSKD